MASKQILERNIRVTARKCYKKIKYFKNPIFILMILIFAYLMLMEPTPEKVTMFVISMIAIYCAYLKDRELKDKKRKEKEKVYNAEL